MPKDGRYFCMSEVGYFKILKARSALHTDSLLSSNSQLIPVLRRGFYKTSMFHLVSGELSMGSNLGF